MSDLSTLSSCDSPSSSSASCSPNRKSFTAEELFEKATSLPAILENGRKVFGPPVEFEGVRPSYVCELYVANLPKSQDEVRFLAWLHRCGVVYEMRLMMESFNLSRGYAFVRYTHEREALIAYELLKCVYVDGERLSVYRSQGKNRLYISNIPKRLSLSSLEAGFKKAFRNMERCTAHAATAAESERGDLNRGFAFIEFYDHETALEAKKKTTPGRMRMWGNDLKVQWAKPKSLSLQFHYGYAEEQEKLRSMEEGKSGANDYCAKLRLFCLANNWCVPVVVYGRCLYASGIQYGGILLKEPTTGQFSCMLMEMVVERDIQDVHVAMCEVAIHLIERNNGFPNYHYIIRILNGVRGEIVFSCANYLDISIQAKRIGANFASSASIVELALAFQVLAQYSSEFIFNEYRRSFLVLRNCFSLTQQSNHVRFYSIFPKFRNNPPLDFGFNDTEIILIVTEAKVIGRESSERNSAVDAHLQKYTDGLQRYVPLKSQRTRYADGYTLRYVSLTKLESREFYHPEQRINVPPIWLTGHSYQKSIFK